MLADVFEKFTNNKSYNPKQESKHIIYLNENKLYGYTMFKFLLISRLK